MVPVDEIVAAVRDTRTRTCVNCSGPANGLAGEVRHPRTMERAHACGVECYREWAGVEAEPGEDPRGNWSLADLGIEAE